MYPVPTKPFPFYNDNLQDLHSPTSHPMLYNRFTLNNNNDTTHNNAIAIDAAALVQPDL